MRHSWTVDATTTLKNAGNTNYGHNTRPAVPRPKTVVQVPVLGGVKALLAAFFIGEIRPVPENIGEVRTDMKSHCHYWRFRIVDIP
jgi:hypothetical protein